MHQEKNIEWLVFNTKGFISLIDDELSRNIPPSLMNDYYIVMVNTYNTINKDRYVHTYPWTA